MFRNVADTWIQNLTEKEVKKGSACVIGNDTHMPDDYPGRNDGNLRVESWTISHQTHGGFLSRQGCEPFTEYTRVFCGAIECQIYDCDNIVCRHTLPEGKSIDLPPSTIRGWYVLEGCEMARGIRISRMVPELPPLQGTGSGYEYSPWSTSSRHGVSALTKQWTPDTPFTHQYIEVFRGRIMFKRYNMHHVITQTQRCIIPFDGETRWHNAYGHGVTIYL